MVICFAGGAPASFKLFRSQARVGDLQWICLDQPELYTDCARHSWGMVSLSFLQSLSFNVVPQYMFLFIYVMCRLVDIASHYYDLQNFPQCEAKRVLEKLYRKREREREENRNRKWMYCLMSCWILPVFLIQKLKAWLSFRSYPVLMCNTTTFLDRVAWPIWLVPFLQIVALAFFIFCVLKASTFIFGCGIVAVSRLRR